MTSRLGTFLPLINQVRALAAGYAAAVASYTNSRSTWLVFKAAEMLKALVPLPEEVVIRPVTVGGASGYFVAIRDGGFGYILRHGNSILGFAGRHGLTEASLRRWAEAYLDRPR